MIAAALWLAPLLDTPVTALAWGVFLAGIVQLLFQIPALWKIGLIPRPRFKRAHEGVSRIKKLMLPALFGSSVAQVNMLLNTILASFLASGSISWLYFSDRFVELPLALFGITLSTVILPKLSSEHATDDPQAFSNTLDWGLRLGLVIALPAMLGLMLLSTPIIATLLQYQAFTAYETRMVAIALSVYAIGLPGFVLVKILAPGFYARQDTATPVRIGIIAVGSNILLYGIVVIPWILLDGPAPHAALAFCAAFASFVNATLLFRKLRQLGVYTPGNAWRSLLPRIAIACAAMIGILLTLTPEPDQWAHWSIPFRGLTLAGLIALAAATYLSALRLQGIKPKDLLIGQ